MRREELKVLMENYPQCQDGEEWLPFEKCTNPARFVKVAPAGTWLVCGNCARKYITEALHPFRIRDYPMWREKIKEKEAMKD